MEELAVNINICDRVYPMKVQTSEEADVRAAGKLINEHANTYSQQFGIHDKQDLLAMVAFDCLIKTLKTNKNSEDLQISAQKIETLIQSVDHVLLP